MAHTFKYLINIYQPSVNGSDIQSLINIYQPSLNGLDIQTLNLTNIYISPVSMAQTFNP